MRSLKRFECQRTGEVFVTGERAEKRLRDYDKGLDIWVRGTVKTVADRDCAGRVTCVWFLRDGNQHQEMTALEHLRHVPLLDVLAEIK